jgi:hypothetical protein
MNTNYNTWFKLGALSALVAVCISACGPVYDTRYTFVPPERPEGRTCVFQCENSKLQCQNMQDMQKQNCEFRAQLEYERCKDRGEKHCYEDYCSSDYSRCDEQYRNCFQACGGTVNRQDVCVAFCEGAPAVR